VIVGIGSDLSDIRRIQASLDRFGERFTLRVYTQVERARSERKGDRAASYAKRFAAKEACAKALGTGIRHGVWWRDMGVVNMPSGRPTMALTGGARKRLDALTPRGYSAQIDLSITDEGPMSMAFVVISAVAVQKTPRKRAAAKSKTKRGKTVARRR
jgi:holo-[acyl-carrier protein] synthase